MLQSILNIYIEIFKTMILFVPPELVFILLIGIVLISLFSVMSKLFLMMMLGAFSGVLYFNYSRKELEKKNKKVKIPLEIDGNESNSKKNITIEEKSIDNSSVLLLNKLFKKDKSEN